MKKRQSKPPVSETLNAYGFTREEQNVMDRLMDCYKLFASLDREHPCEMDEFKHGIHRIQSVLMQRVIRRMYPDGWPTYEC